MTDIMEYTVAATVYTESVESAMYRKDLEEKVNALIASGWQPFGNLTAVNSGDSVVFFQPMVKYAATGVAP